MTTTPPVTWTLSGFGDEIDPDPHVQIAVLHALSARYGVQPVEGPPLLPIPRS